MMEGGGPESKVLVSNFNLDLIFGDQELGLGFEWEFRLRLVLSIISY